MRSAFAVTLRRWASFASVAVVLVLACEPAGPQVTIISPAAGATVGSTVLVTLRASPGLKVVPADGGRKAGEGHFHVLVDEPIPGGDSVIANGPGIYHLGAGTDTVTITGLGPGNHRLVAVFAYGDHLPLREVKTDTARVVVGLR